jgi:hypothetical protein
MIIASDLNGYTNWQQEEGAKKVFRFKGVGKERARQKYYDFVPCRLNFLLKETSGIKDGSEEIDLYFHAHTRV